MSLHDQIMNIPMDYGTSHGIFSSRPEAYETGHRDARHAAAELAIVIEHQRDELLAAAKNLRDVKGRHHSEQAFKALVEAVAKVEAA